MKLTSFGSSKIWSFDLKIPLLHLVVYTSNWCIPAPLLYANVADNNEIPEQLVIRRLHATRGLRGDYN